MSIEFRIPGFFLPSITYDPSPDIHAIKVGRVYELSSEDVAAIVSINEKRKLGNDKLWLPVGGWNSPSKGYIANAVCYINMHNKTYQEHYDALNKIKPFSEREVIEVRG